MLIVRFADPKSKKNRVIGTMIMSSWLCPNDEPFSAKMPMIWYGRSLILTILFSGDSLGKSFF